MFIDGLSARTGGGLVYLQSILRHMPKLNDQCRVVVLVTDQNSSSVMAHARQGIEHVTVHVRSVVGRVLYENLILPFVLIRSKADVLFAPSDIAPVWCPCRLVLGIQNLNIYEQLPRDAITLAAKRIVQRFFARSASRRADRIVFQSRFSALKVSKSLGIPRGRSVVIPHGSDGPIRGLPSSSSASMACFVPHGIILCVANVSRHKNVEVLLEAYALLDEEQRHKHELVIVGRGDAGYLTKLKTHASLLGIGGRVRFAGWVPNDQLGHYYHAASVFVLPSLVETFGIPIVEAMAFGVPTVVSNASSIPEIVADAALLVDPHDPRAFAAEISRVLTDSVLREELIQKGLKHASAFSWGDSASKLMDVLLGEIH